MIWLWVHYNFSQTTFMHFMHESAGPQKGPVTSSISQRRMTFLFQSSVAVSLSYLRLFSTSFFFLLFLYIYFLPIFIVVRGVVILCSVSHFLCSSVCFVYAKFMLSNRRYRYCCLCVCECVCVAAELIVCTTTITRNKLATKY